VTGTACLSGSGPGCEGAALSTFEFFLTFYGLILGLSVVELVGGAARMVDQGHRLKVGWLIPALAIYLALEITDFWGSTWALFREAPRNYALYVLSLIIAGSFYLGTYLAFPREIAHGEALDDHYWARRRLILSSVVLAKILVYAISFSLIIGNGAGAPPEPFVTSGVFVLVAAAAIVLPRGRLAVGALALLLFFTLAHVVESSVRLIGGPPWPMVMAN
jgi:hypothetical protein